MEHTNIVVTSIYRDLFFGNVKHAGRKIGIPTDKQREYKKQGHRVVRRRGLHALV